MSVRVDGVMVMTVVGVAAAAGLAYFIKKKGGQVATALNPASDKNIAYRAVNGTLQSALGLGDSSTLGTALFDATHTTYDPNDPSTAGEPFSWSKTADLASWLNPAAAAAKVVTSSVGSFSDNIGLGQAVGWDLGGPNFGLNPGEETSW